MSLSSRIQSLVEIRGLRARQQPRLLVQLRLWGPAPHRMVRHDQQAAGAATRWGVTLWPVPRYISHPHQARSRQVRNLEAPSTQCSSTGMRTGSWPFELGFSAKGCSNLVAVCVYCVSRCEPEHPKLEVVPDDKAGGSHHTSCWLLL